MAEICKEKKRKESSVGVLGDSWVWAGREGCGVGCKHCSFEVETMRERRRRRWEIWRFDLCYVLSCHGMVIFKKAEVAAERFCQEPVGRFWSFDHIVVSVIAIDRIGGLIWFGGAGCGREPEGWAVRVLGVEEGMWSSWNMIMVFWCWGCGRISGCN